MRRLRSISVLFLSVSAAFALLMPGCRPDTGRPGTFQGYVEGDFVHVSSPLSGKLDRLFVQKGEQVDAGSPLFDLDNTAERTSRDETGERLAQMRAQLADVRKGKRPTEIESIAAQLNIARTALQYAETELARQEKLLAVKVVALQDVDRVRTQRDQEHQRVAQLEADLHTARLGARSDQIAAVEAQARSVKAALDRSEWDLGQKRQYAPVSGVVFDTLYRKGEWIAAGRPAVLLLPPANIKVRVFVPQALLSSIRHGIKAKVEVDGLSSPLSGTVRYVSPQAEYTPPVIYSRESRQKLVYLVELAFDQASAVRLHPGQPVTVVFGTGS